MVLRVYFHLILSNLVPCAIYELSVYGEYGRYPLCSFLWNDNAWNSRKQRRRNRQCAFNSRPLSVVLNSPRPLFTSPWSQRKAFHRKSPECGWGYSCNHLVCFSSFSMDPSLVFVFNSDTCQHHNTVANHWFRWGVRETQ